MIDLKHYKEAITIRVVENLFLKMFSEGKLTGTVHTCTGQEFSGIAFNEALRKDDIVFSNHRCHGHYIARTKDVKGIIAELNGKKTGTCGGIGSSQHLCNMNFFSNGIQGGIMPVAAGMALAEKKKSSGRVVTVFIGDGTLGEGVVYETFNLAMLLKLPLLIICENNYYAQSTKIENNLSGSILKRAEAFGIETFHSSTWELDALFEEAQQSVLKVREKTLPVFHLVETYRLNPHSKGDDDRKSEEIERYRKLDPINKFKIKNELTYETLENEIKIYVDELYKQSLSDEELDFQSYLPKKMNECYNLEYENLERIDQRVVNRINTFFKEVMEKDNKVLFIGEDILSPYGGAFKAAKDLSDLYPEQVISTPISEAGITGLSNGLALSGYRPFLEIMFGDFITLAMDQIINHASKFHHMYNKKVTCPIVIRTPMGGGRGYGPTHSQTLDKFITGIDNLKVIAINSFTDPKKIYENIYQNECHPVIVIENKIDYTRKVGNKKLQNYQILATKEYYPTIICKPLHSKPTITIASYGGIASDLFDLLLELFIETEYLVEFIILTKITDADISPILDSISVTERFIFVEEGSAECGIGAEIVAKVIESTEPKHLKKIGRIGAVQLPIPSAKNLEGEILPNSKLLQTLTKQLNHDNFR